MFSFAHSELNCSSKDSEAEPDFESSKAVLTTKSDWDYCSLLPKSFPHPTSLFSVSPLSVCEPKPSLYFKCLESPGLSTGKRLATALMDAVGQN